MITERRFGWSRLTATVIFGAGLVIGGCGGGSTAPSSPQGGTPSAVESDTPSKPAKITSGPGGRMGKDGDLSAREKRNLKKGIKPPG
jgi:hypothetical protein